MITSPQNEKLKLVRKLAERRAREREGLFVAEGEDLVEAGLRLGAEPRFLLRAAGAEVPGAERSEEVEPGLLDDVSALGSGTRVLGVWPVVWREPAGPVCLYLDAVGDPGNVGAAVRTVHALVGGTVVVGEGTADPYSPKAVRAAMGSLFATPPARGAVDATPRPRVALTARGGEWPVGTGSELPPPPLTLCLGSEREGLSDAVLRACDRRATIPLRPGGAESLNVAAVAAICCERVSSAAVRAQSATTAAETGGDPR